MTEGPIRELSILLSKSNKTHVKFITIKDNSQKTKWCTIGKVNDWIRRYSTNYYIVRGLEGGIHFHLVALLHKHAVLKVTAKGIHFHIQSLNRMETFPMEDVILDQIRLDCHLRDMYREKAIVMLSIPPPCVEISLAIQKYWKSKHAKAKRLQAKLTKCLHVNRIFSYLEKNLMENPPAIIMEYNTHIIKYNGITL